MDIISLQGSNPFTAQPKTEYPLKALETPEFVAPKCVNKDVLQDSPASIVSLSTNTNNTALPVYELPAVNVVQLRQTQDKSPSAEATSKQLSTDLGSIRVNKSSFSVHNFFQHIGSLSRTTNEYKNEARSMSIASNKDIDKLKIDFSTPTGKPQETVNFSVHTKDGDLIEVKLQHTTKENGDALSFSFKVTGKLSSEEQDALDKLSAKLGDVADDFFRTGTTELHGLKEFDDTNLTDFHIDFSKPKTPEKYSTISYDFSIDPQTKTQHLIAKDADDYTLDITNNLQTLLGNHMPDNSKTLSNYLTLIRNSLNQYSPLLEDHSNTQSIQFIIDGFTSMLQKENPPLTAENPSKTEKIIAATDTGIPDFNAKIKAPLLRDRRNYLFPEAFSLTLEQTTKTELHNNGQVLIKQVNSMEQNSSQIAGIKGSVKGDLTSGNFVYKITHEKQQIIRLLDIQQGDVSNLITEHTSSTNNTEKIYNASHLQDTHIEQHQERKLTQLSDEIQKHKYLAQTFNVLSYLEKTKENLFS